MTTLDVQQNSARAAFEQAASYGRRAESNPSTTAAPPKDAAETSQRTVQDTVSLSEGGQKIVNLNRGQDLSASLKDAPTDTTFTDQLRKATEDVFRIMKLFSQTVRSAFNL
jgi:hypothetical protein